MQGSMVRRRVLLGQAPLLPGSWKRHRSSSPMQVPILLLLVDWCYSKIKLGKAEVMHLGCALFRHIQLRLASPTFENFNGPASPCEV